MILSGGRTQSKVRALFVFLLPEGETLYTASEVVKHSFPWQDHKEEYEKHYRRLSQLATRNHIEADDPATNARSRNRWLEAISDNVLKWGFELLDELSSQMESNPHATVTIDLETLQLHVGSNSPSFVTDKAVTKRTPKIFLTKTVPIGMVALILFGLLIPTKNEPSYISHTQKEYSLEDYLRNTNAPPPIQPTPPPPGSWLDHWQPGIFSIEQIVKNNPPLIISSLNYPCHRQALDLDCGLVGDW